MLDIKIFSQRDPKWSGNKHGTSSSTIGKTGCTISVIASMLVHAGYDTDPGRLNKLLTDNKGYSNGNLVVWSAIERLFPKVKWVYRHYEYNNDLAREWIKDKGIMPIIQVGAAPIGGAPGGKHWVGFVGDHKSLDPWTGAIVDTSTWEPTGMALYDYTPTQGGNMADCLVTNTEENRKKYETLVSNSSKADGVVRYLGLVDKEKGTADDVSYDTIEKSIAARIGNADSLRSKLAAAETEVENRKEQISRLTEDLTSARQLYKDLLTSENQTRKECEEKARLLLAQLEDTQSKLDEAAKAKGRAILDLADAKSKLEACQKGQPSQSLLEFIIDWIKSWKG